MGLTLSSFFLNMEFSRRRSFSMAIKLNILLLCVLSMDLLSVELEHIYPPDEGRVYYVNTDANGTVYASTFVDTYVSVDHGESWSKKWNFRMMPGQMLNDTIMVFKLVNSYHTDDYEKLTGADWELYRKGAQFGYYNIKTDELKIIYSYNDCENCRNEYVDNFSQFTEVGGFHSSFRTNEGHWFMEGAAVQITPSGELYAYRHRGQCINALSYDQLVTQYLDTLYIVSVDSSKFAKNSSPIQKRIPIRTQREVKRINDSELLMYCYSKETNNLYFITYNAKTDMYYDSVSVKEKLNPFGIFYEHGLFNFGRDTIITVDPPGKKIYFTIDRGESWDSVALNGRYSYTWSNGDEPYFVRNKEFVFLSGFNGVYRLDLKNRTAEQVNNGLHAAEITDAVADVDGTLYAIVRKGGIYKKKKDETEWVELPVMNDDRINVDYESIEILGDGRILVVAGRTYVSNEDKTAMYMAKGDTACFSEDGYRIHFNPYYNSLFSIDEDGYFIKWNGACFDDFIPMPELEIYQIHDYVFNKDKSLIIISRYGGEEDYMFNDLVNEKQRIYYSEDDFKTFQPAYITTNEPDLLYAPIKANNIAYLSDDLLIVPPNLISHDGGKSWEYKTDLMQELEYDPLRTNARTQTGIGIKGSQALYLAQESRLMEIDMSLDHSYTNFAKEEYRFKKIKHERDNHVYLTMQFTSRQGILKSKTPLVSVEENDPAEQEGVLVYPNPATTVVSLKTDLPVVSVIITDALGNEFGKSHSPQNDIDISYLPNGVYYLTINTHSGAYLKKFIKVE